MSISRYNSEGYCDPVPYLAITRMERKKYRPLVYICSPYKGDTEGNARKAQQYCRFAVDHGAIPVAPHLFFPQFMSEETERDLVVHMGMVLLGKCRELWVCGDRISDGMRREMAFATARGMRIRHVKEDVVHGQCKEADD